MDAVNPEGEGLVRSRIPYHWYSDSAIAERERNLIFRRSWHYAGHISSLSEPGSQLPVDVGGVPLVVVRDAAGELRAFINVCRHRGSVLVDEARVRQTIQCPYHAWTWNLEGTLTAAPRVCMSDATEADLGLAAAVIDTWGPLVFVSPGSEVPPLAEWLGGIPDEIASAGIDIDQLRFHSRAESRLGANWKLCIENYLECYHCQIAHPGFSQVIDVAPEAYRGATGRWHASQYGTLRDPAADGFATAGGVERAQFHFLWPGTVINCAPGYPNLSIGSASPDGPAATRRSLDYLVAPDAPAEWVAEMLAWDDHVGTEDVALVESAQRGVGSGSLDSGVLLADSESLIAHFQQLTLDALA